MISVCIWRESGKRRGQSVKNTYVVVIFARASTLLYLNSGTCKRGIQTDKPNPLEFFYCERKRSSALSVSWQKQKGGGLLILTIVFTSSLTLFYSGAEKRLQTMGERKITYCARCAAHALRQLF